MAPQDPRDSKAFRQACGQFLTGVTVVTALLPDREPIGFTANSFTSVSLDPPLVLVCVDRKITSHGAFRPGGAYAVHVLAADQEELSARFARGGTDKFAGLTWKPGLGGLPLLEGALAVLQCRIVHTYEGGDHTIFVGRVEAMDVSDVGAAPLGFFRGRYVRLQSNP